MAINNTLFRSVVTALTPHFVDSEKRRYYLDMAFFGEPLLSACPSPDADLTARAFSARLVRVLDREQSETRTGELSLLVLLTAMAADLKGWPSRRLTDLANQLRGELLPAPPPPSIPGEIHLAQAGGRRLSLRQDGEEIPDGGTVRLDMPVTVRFTIRNDDLFPIAIQSLVIGARGPGAARAGWDAPILPFPVEQNLHLEPNESHSYKQSRTIPEAGDYFIEPNLQDVRGGWHGIAPFTRINFTVIE